MHVAARAAALPSAAAMQRSDCASTSGRALHGGSQLGSISRALLRGRPAPRHRCRRAVPPPTALWRLVGGSRATKPRADKDLEVDAVAERLVGLTAAEAARVRGYTEAAYLTGRTAAVTQHFPSALGVDDFLHRLEIALFAYGFHGDNSIAMVNLCRDEVTVTLKQKIDQVFGSSFNTNGLGGVLTCGVTGVKAGLSHAPVSRGSGKERYVFFSFPHISIDARGRVGTISRPGRPEESCACGALNQALIDIKRDGLVAACKIPGVHEPLDPEFTILKQRLARRLRYEGAGDGSVSRMGLTDMTRVAERTISDDLEYLISHTVDPRKADYAVVTGVQIHNWGARFDDESPNLEYVAPGTVYAVVNGEKTFLDLKAMPSLTPRMVQLLAHSAPGSGPRNKGAEHEPVCNSSSRTTVREIEPPYLYNTREARRAARRRAESYAHQMVEEGLHPEMACPWPSWQSNLRHSVPPRDEADNSAVIDDNFHSDDELVDMWSKLQDKYVSNSTGQGSKYMRNGKAVVGMGLNGEAVIDSSHKEGVAPNPSAAEDGWTSSEE